MDPETLGQFAPSGAPTLRVLCVDDNHDIADSEADILCLMGFEARACYDGPSALSEAAHFLPGVCLIDLNMPGMEGDEVAIRLRAEAKHRPMLLVAVTAMSNDLCERRISEAGFDMHLVKPVDPHNLLTVLDELGRKWAAALLGGISVERAECPRTQDVPRK